MQKILLKFFILLLIPISLCGRKVLVRNSSKIINKHNQLFDIQPLNFILDKNPSITYIKCFDSVYFDYKQLPFSIKPEWQPNEGFFNPTFILKIPNGVVQEKIGIVCIDNHFVQELVWRNISSIYLDPMYHKKKNIVKKNGRIAVLAQPAYDNYFHWTIEILGRLALLEIFNIEFDYLYVPQNLNYMKESLHLWGISPEKIIDSELNDVVIQAEEVIVPSLVANTNRGFTPFVNYIHPYILEYVKNKLSAAVKDDENITFNKKIFISRKDSKLRNILNEDEVFEQLKIYGFERYELSKLSVENQIRLFRQAKVIVSPQGTGLANIMYCRSSVKIIELYQGLSDSAIFNMAQILHLNLIPIQTIPFEKDFVKAWQGHTYMPISVIEEIKNYIQL